MHNFITPDFAQVAKPAGTAVKEMLTVVRDGKQTLVRINSSSLSILQTCARKAFYLLDQGYRAKTQSPPLVFGSAIHKALEVFYGHPRAERSLPRDFADYAETLAHGHNPPEKHFLYDAILAFVEAAQPLRDLPDTDKRSLVSGVWTLTHYFKTYFTDAYTIYRDERGPFIERTFSLPLLEGKLCRVELFGTIDFALKNEATGEVLIGDHKTSSQMGMDFLNRIKPNHQYTGYMIGAREVFGINSENFLVNGIQVKARPTTSRGGPPTFTRQITRRTEADFEEFRKAVAWSAASFLEWQETGNWPLGNVDACSSFGGCGFLEVCSAPNELRNNILEAKFTKGHV